MSQLYAHKKFVGEVMVAEQDGVLLTQVGEFSVKKGEKLFNPLNGDPEIITDSRLNNLYLPVESPVKRKAPDDFAQYFMGAYGEYTGEELNQTEDEQYINGTLKISKDNL